MFTLDEASVGQSAGGVSIGNILYRDNIVGMVFLDGEDEGKDFAERKAIGLSFSSLDFGGLTVSYKGVSIGDPKDKIVSVLGTPDGENEYKGVAYEANYFLGGESSGKFVRLSTYNGNVEEIVLYVK